MDDLAVCCIKGSMSQVIAEDQTLVCLNQKVAGMNESCVDFLAFGKCLELLKHSYGSYFSAVVSR